MAGFTVQVVGDPLPPAVAPLVPPAGEAGPIATVGHRPGIWGPEEVVNLFAPELDD